MVGIKHLEIDKKINTEIDIIITNGVIFNVLNLTNFDIDEVKSIMIKPIDIYTLAGRTIVGHTIDESNHIAEKMEGRTIIGAILKAYDTYNRVHDTRLLDKNYFNPVNFSYTTPGKLPVYLISLILLFKHDHDKYYTKILHLGTYNKVHRDILFNIYGFRYSKDKMKAVNKLITQMDLTDEDVKNVAWNADSAAMHINDDDIIDFIRPNLLRGRKNYHNKDGTYTKNGKKSLNSLVTVINHKISTDNEQQYSLWVGNPENSLMIAAVRNKVMEAEDQGAAAAMEAAPEDETEDETEDEAEDEASPLPPPPKLPLGQVMTKVAKLEERLAIEKATAKATDPQVQGAPMTLKRGGKRRKTKRKIRKTKTHKRKSNKKMKRSRKSRRRHKKK